MKKTKIIKIRKPKKGEASDYTGILLEDIQEQFKVFAEDLNFVKEKVSNIEEEIIFIKYQILDIKSEIREIRNMLEKKADIQRVDKLEKRVFQIERDLEILKRR